MKIIKSLLLSFIALLFIQTSYAASNIPSSTILAGEKLMLNGTGMRTKFFFDVYEGALYTANKVSNIQEILQSGKNIRVAMFIKYGEIEAKKMKNGWHEGFENNMSKEEKTVYKNEMQSFVDAFGTAFKGDVIKIDMTAKGTAVVINNKVQGRINNADFNEMVLRIWFGNKPADDDLKAGMLGK